MLHYLSPFFRPFRDPNGSCWDRQSEQAKEMVALLFQLLSTQLYHRLWQACWQWGSSLFAPSLLVPLLMVTICQISPKPAREKCRAAPAPLPQLSGGVRSRSSHSAQSSQGCTLRPLQRRFWKTFSHIKISTWPLTSGDVMRSFFFPSFSSARTTSAASCLSFPINVFSWTRCLSETLFWCINIMTIGSRLSKFAWFGVCSKRDQQERRKTCTFCPQCASSRGVHWGI